MKNLIGTFPKESSSISKYRKHQGWWRAFVLNEPEGEYLDNLKQVKKVCNRINDGETSYKNFLSEEIVKSARKAVEIQKKKGKGIIDENRLYNNLLSSQPLAFNFFGWFMNHKEIALKFIQSIIPNITELVDVVFEYAPDSSKDNSAFDFGFIVKVGNKKGFIGFECKYTDSFSYKRPKTDNYYGDDLDNNYNKYFKLFDENRDRFLDEYNTYVRDKNYNQLFRNELLGVQLIKDFDFILTGLFCNHEDVETIEAGLEFQKKIGNGKNDFIVLTYADYIEGMQKLELTWEERKLVMMLWVRYCGLELSKEIIG